MTESLSQLPIIQFYLTSMTNYSQETTHSAIHRTLKSTFKQVPFFAFVRRSPNLLRDLLVRAKLANDDKKPKLPASTFRCNSRHGCLTCPYISHGKTLYTFTNTGKQDKLNITLYYLSDSTNLTYLIQCRRCKKQCIGETKRNS